jgi:hypothetical protein
MVFIFLIILFFTIAICTFYYSKHILGLNSYINPITIVTLISLPIDTFKMVIGPIFLTDNLSDKGLIYAYAMTDLKLFFQLLILLLFLKLKNTRDFTKKLINSFKPVYNISFFKPISNFFFFISLLFFFLLMYNSGEYLKWITDPREAYISNRSGSGLFYALSINFISLSFFFRCFATNSIKKAIKYFIFYCFLLIPFGSKGLFINFLIFFIIIIYKIDKKYLLKFSIPAILCALFLVLFNFKANLTNNLFSDIASYFDYYINAAMYYNDYINNNIQLYYGKIFTSSFWEYAPRLFFPDKPSVYGMLNVVENYYPGGPESGNTPAFGGEVSSFADFGIIGVIFSSIFDFSLFFKAIAFLYLFKYKRFKLENYSILDILILMITFSPSFGIYAPNFYFIILTFIIIIMISLFKYFNPSVKYNRQND